jgi:hypothetical protein
MLQIKRRKAPIPINNSPDPINISADSIVRLEQFEESGQTKAAESAKTLTSWRFLAIGAMGINGVLLLFVVIMQFIAASKPIAPFVTRGNGETESLEYSAGNKRSPALITDFVRTSMIGIFTWRNTLPVDGNPPDPGVVIGKNGGKISTTSYRYTFALSTGFAEIFREKLAEIAKDLTAGNIETVYIISSISTPVEISAGTWTVDIVGDMYVGNGTSKRIYPISRKVTVRAVPPLTLSEVSQMYKQPGLANAIAHIRAKGLEITNIDKLVR